MLIKGDGWEPSAPSRLAVLPFDCLLSAPVLLQPRTAASTRASSVSSTFSTKEST